MLQCLGMSLGFEGPCGQTNQPGLVLFRERNETHTVAVQHTHKDALTLRETFSYRLRRNFQLKMWTPLSSSRCHFRSLRNVNKLPCQNTPPPPKGRKAERRIATPPPTDTDLVRFGFRHARRSLSIGLCVFSYPIQSDVKHSALRRIQYNRRCRTTTKSPGVREGRGWESTIPYSAYHLVLTGPPNPRPPRRSEEKTVR